MIKILLIEDDIIISRATKLILRYPEYELTCVETGAAAIAEYRQDSQQIVILDMFLPDMSGLSVFNHILDIEALPSVITCSAYGTTNDIQEIQSFPNTRNVPKPYQIIELKNAVHDLAINQYKE
jgi:CheY-like chemotaxis protein